MLSPDLYLRVREKEGRLLADEIVTRLPEVPPDHALKAEWQARAASLRRIRQYAERLPRLIRILEVGCGNGWLTHGLSLVPQAQVWGLDLPSAELKQAARLFNAPNTGFLAAEISFPPFAKGTLDMIVAASVIQYFPDLPEMVRRLLALLGPKGELHILDSPLYKEADVVAARQRSEAYYASLGFPEMASHYFHHTVAELQPFSPDWMYRPDSAQARATHLVGRPDSPFPWLRIRMSNQ